MFQSVTLRQLKRRGSQKANFVKVTPLMSVSSQPWPEMTRPNPLGPPYALCMHTSEVRRSLTLPYGHGKGESLPKGECTTKEGRWPEASGSKLCLPCAATVPPRAGSMAAALAATDRTKPGCNNGSLASLNLSPYQAFAANGSKFLSISRMRPDREAPRDDSASNAPGAARQQSPRGEDMPDAERFLAGWSLGSLQNSRRKFPCRR